MPGSWLPDSLLRKRKRRGLIVGKRADSKRAIVTLAPGDEIINSPLIRVTRENLSEYRLQLEQWGWTAD